VPMNSVIITGISHAIENLKEEFAQFKDWEERYQHIIMQGKSLEPLSDDQKIEANIVKGCQSLVWLTASLNENGTIHFKADSDALIVKGLLSVLLYVYSDQTPDDILNTRPNFLKDLGLSEHLSMNRANGLNAMMKQVSFYAMAFQAKLNMEALTKKS
jgi:cysteine desulfuration protein SufE